MTNLCEKQDEMCPRGLNGYAGHAALDAAVLPCGVPLSLSLVPVSADAASPRLLVLRHMI